MFDWSGFKSLDLSNFNTSNVEDMHYMFFNCPHLTSINISSFDTSKVTSMDYMFMYCKDLTSIDLSSFNTSHYISLNEFFKENNHLIYIDFTGFHNPSLDYSEMFGEMSRRIIIKLSKENLIEMMDLIPRGWIIIT